VFQWLPVGSEMLLWVWVQGWNARRTGMDVYLSMVSQILALALYTLFLFHKQRSRWLEEEDDEDDEDAWWQEWWQELWGESMDVDA
jgi:hypothetical protein